jgi:adenylate cyclase
MWSGVVMFAYLAIHLLNHALGIVSLDLAERGLRIEMAVWRSPPGTLVLYGSAGAHFALALWTLYARREWKLPLVETLRLFSGFTFPLLLIGHAVTARLGDTAFAITATYSAIITNLVASGNQGMQLGLLAPGWLHGCLGLWITLRQFKLMKRMKPVLIAAIILVPVLAAFGFLRMAAEVATLHHATPLLRDLSVERTALAAWKNELTTAYVGAVLFALLAGRFRTWILRWLTFRASSRPSASVSVKRPKPPATQTPLKARIE